jgi:hypothetical protein
MKSPVLLILFNRPDLTQELFSIIEKHCDDRRIYIAIDGPRQNNDSDTKLCAEVVHMANNFASQHKDHCRLLIQPKNLGCGNGVKSAIDWFFEHEEKGIILEDDCHPCYDFFEFQDSMLDYFKNNNEIFIVSGTCLIPDCIKINEGSFVSKYLSLWGWGSWRRSWKLYNFHIHQSDRIEWESYIKNSSHDYLEELYWLRIFNYLCGASRPHTWDYQLLFSAWKNGAKSICSSRNLVINKGFRNDATHTKTDKEVIFQKYENIQKPVLPYQIYDANFDKIIFLNTILQGDIMQIISIFNENNDKTKKSEVTCKKSDTRFKNKVKKWLKRLVNQ